MTLFWIGFIGFLAVVMVVSFFVAKKAIGNEAALQNITYAIPSAVIGILFALGLSILPNTKDLFKYFLLIGGLLNLSILVWMMFRNKSFKGEIVHTFRPTQQSKILFGYGIFQLISQPILLVSSVSLYLGTGLNAGEIFNRMSTQISSVVLMMSLGAFFLYMSQRSCIHQYGLNFSGFFVCWERITRYKFENIPQNTLRARYISDIPIVPGIIILAMDSNDKAKLLEILAEKRPDLEPTP
jgi:hypothetical protein